MHAYDVAPCARERAPTRVSTIRLPADDSYRDAPKLAFADGLVLATSYRAVFVLDPLAGDVLARVAAPWEPPIDGYTEVFASVGRRHLVAASPGEVWCCALSPGGDASAEPSDEDPFAPDAGC